MAQVTPIDPGFSTADAEYPELQAAAGTVTLRFRDWQERGVSVVFSEVCAYRWQEAGALLPGEPYDGSSELLESPWLAEHIKQGVIPPESAYRHFRFNFNACGQLEVLCFSFVTQAHPSSGSPR